MNVLPRVRKTKPSELFLRRFEQEKRSLGIGELHPFRQVGVGAIVRDHQYGLIVFRGAEAQLPEQSLVRDGKIQPSGGNGRFFQIFQIAEEAADWFWRGSIPEHAIFKVQQTEKHTDIGGNHLQLCVLYQIAIAVNQCPGTAFRWFCDQPRGTPPFNALVHVAVVLGKPLWGLGGEFVGGDALMAQIYRQKGLSRINEVGGLTMILSLNLRDQISRHMEGHPSELPMLLQAMEANILWNLSKDVFALKLNLSLARLRFLFRKHLNTTSRRYLHELRIRKVERLLLLSEIRVQEVVVQCGYGSISRFIYASKARHFAVHLYDAGGDITAPKHSAQSVFQFLQHKQENRFPARILYVLALGII